jgi:hypothetical protein
MNCSMKNVYLFLCSALLASLAVAKEPEWLPLDPVQGITVKMPAAPEVERRSDPSALGVIKTQLFRGHAPWGRYTVGYVELPPAAGLIAVSSPETVFDEARDQVLKDAQAVAKSYVDNGRYTHAKDLYYENHEMQGWSNIVIMGTRVYVVDARVKRGQPKAKYVDPFFASLTIKKVRRHVKS